MPVFGRVNLDILHCVLFLSLSIAVLRQMVVYGFARFYTILEALVRFYIDPTWPGQGGGLLCHSVNTLLPSLYFQQYLNTLFERIPVLLQLSESV